MCDDVASISKVNSDIEQLKSQLENALISQSVLRDELELTQQHRDRLLVETEFLHDKLSATESRLKDDIASLQVKLKLNC